MGLFKAIFGKKEEEEARPPLTHASQLRKGDIVKFGFADQQELSRETFEIVGDATYDFEGETDVSFTMKGSSGSVVFMSVVSEDGEEYLAVSKKMARGAVKEAFGEEELGAVFEEGAGTELVTKAIPKGFEGWLADEYTEVEDCSKGVYCEGDYRGRRFPYDSQNACGLDFYALEDDEEDFAIEIEVYEGSETEVNAVVYLELSLIEEMWPARKKTEF